MHPERHRLPWEPFEDELLRARFGTLTTRELAELLKRTPDTITKRLQKLKVAQQVVLQCAECGEPLVQPATGHPRRYCSRSCQEKKLRAQVRTWTCWVCGDPYESTGPLLNCTVACKQAADAQKQRDLRDAARGTRTPRLSDTRTAAHVMSLLEAGWSQRTIQRELGISQSALSQWLRSRR